jgi:hypothetical protein
MKNMQGYMADDLSALFEREIQQECQIGSKKYIVLVDDLVNDEIEGYGGPEYIEMQKIHFKTTDVAEVDDGQIILLATHSKIVQSSILSADGNELIVTVRGS